MYPYYQPPMPYGMPNQYDNQQQFGANPYNQNVQNEPVHVDYHPIFVNGEDGARAFASKMRPNDNAIVFDNGANSNLMYLVTTDGAGYPKIQPLEYKEYNEAPANSTGQQDFVTRSEFDAAISRIEEAIHGEPNQQPNEPATRAQRQAKRTAKPAGDDVSD